MERMYYSKQNYNQLKKKQYEEYIRRQNMSYIYMKKQYEEYIRRQNMSYIYMKKYYEEYIKRQNIEYINMKRYYEEYIKKQNSYYMYIKQYYEKHNRKSNDILKNVEKSEKTNTSQSKPFIYVKTTNIKDKHLNDNCYEINKIEDNNHCEIDNIENESVNDNCFKSEDNSTNDIYLEIENSEEGNTIDNCCEIGNIEKENVNDNYFKINNSKNNNANDTYLERENSILDNCFEINNIGNNDAIDNYFEIIKIKDSNINDNDIKSSINNLEYKKDDLYQDNYFENKSYIKNKDLNKEKYLENNTEEFLNEDYNIFIREELCNKNNISNESLYVKLPVVLAESSVTIPIEDTIILEQEIMEIKRIEKNLYLTQSRLIPFSSSVIEPNSGVLFITGFIRKNIEYATKDCNNAETDNVCGNIRQCTVEVPFEFTTRLTFLRAPIFNENITTKELEFFTNKFQEYEECSDSLIGCDPCEQSFIFSEVFNEKPFVEPVKAIFNEVHINKNIILNKGTSKEQVFTEITEKTIVNIILKVLQKQQLKIAIE